MKTQTLDLECSLNLPSTTSSREVTKPSIAQPCGPTSDASRSRLLGLPREPFLKVRWEPVLFFHFRIAPEILAPVVPPMFELDLHEGTARLSLAVVHMCGFRSCRPCSRGLIVQGLGQQRFLNLRTYVKCGGERGVLFIHGWLSRPGLLPLPSHLLGLPYRFARFEARRQNESIIGHVTDRGARGSLTYRVGIPSTECAAVCAGGSAEEFAMEQYSGFFARRDHGYVFRVWHPPWLHRRVEAQLDDTSLLTTAFPWFARATFTSAHLTEPIPDVWLSRAYRLPGTRPGKGSHRVLSAFYEMP